MKYDWPVLIIERLAGKWGNDLKWNIFDILKAEIIILVDLAVMFSKLGKRQW
jgi:hypothetical protein